MKTNRRTVGAVAIAALALGVGTSAAAWSGTSDETTDEVADSIPIQKQSPARQDRLNPADLECDGLLVANMHSLRVGEPSDGIPMVEDAEVLMEELAASADFPGNEHVAAAVGQSTEVTPGQPVRFHGHDSEGRLKSMVDISSTTDGFVIDQAAMCSSSHPMDFPEDLPIHPLGEVNDEEASR